MKPIHEQEWGVTHNGHYISDHNGDGDLVALVYGRRAALISAAPDMARALHRMYVAWGGIPESAAQAQARAEAIAALRKAGVIHD